MTSGRPSARLPGAQTAAGIERLNLARPRRPVLDLAG